MTPDELRESHRRRCEREMTRDVVFLFQWRQLRSLGVPDGYEPGDDGGYNRVGDDCDETCPEHITYREAFDQRLTQGDWDVPCVEEVWHTEGVWLDRDEAERFGKSKQYNYPDGWRVYGVPAYGELAGILRGDAAEAERDRLREELALAHECIGGFVVEATDSELTRLRAFRDAAVKALRTAGTESVYDLETGELIRSGHCVDLDLVAAALALAEESP